MPASKKCWGARGLSSHITDEGPPDRMMPLGFSRSKASAALLKGANLGIDPGFADAAGDELSHLAAEVHDENGIL